MVDYIPIAIIVVGIFSIGFIAGYLVCDREVKIALE